MVEDSYIQHYGIKGMKWGIRRFQKENGDLTAAGKKRYADEDKQERKNTRRDNLISQLKRNGYSEKEAEVAADKRIKAQKIATAAAGVAVTAAAAYLIGKNIQARTDQIIKAGDTLQRIEMKDTGGKLHDTFYAAYNAKDKQRYKTLLGYQRQRQTGKAYIMKLAVNKDIKVASQKSAQKAFKDLYDNDPAFRKRAAELLRAGNPGIEISPTASKKTYQLFNKALVYESVMKTGASNQFYDKLKSQGYGAVQDINDMKFSGYAAKNPLIFFEGANKSIVANSVKTMEEVSIDEYGKELGKATIASLTPSAIKYGAIGTTAVALGMRSQEKRGNIGKLNENQAKKVNKLERRGLTTKEIAKRLNVPEGRIYAYLNNYQ